jgi:hypothetical protein
MAIRQEGKSGRKRGIRSRDAQWGICISILVYNPTNCVSFPATRCNKSRVSPSAL